jgi:hypothetical protein
LDRPACSADLAHSDFLFPKITKIFKARHFADIGSNASIGAALKAIPEKLP